MSILEVISDDFSSLHLEQQHHLVDTVKTAESKISLGYVLNINCGGDINVLTSEELNIF